MYKAVVSAKGQIVIPSALRKKFGVKKRTQVCLYERDGEIIIKPITDEYIQSMAGMARTKGRLPCKCQTLQSDCSPARTGRT